MGFYFLIFYVFIGNVICRSFFFSSRRRHTRWPRDWGSDVCSSDLARAGQATYLEDPELNVEAWGIPLNRPLSFRSANPIVVGLRQKLPFFGKRGLQSDMAGQEVKIAEEELRAKEIDIVAKIRSAYADVFMAAKTIEINQELLQLNRQLGATAENLYRVGKAPQQD